MGNETSKPDIKLKLIDKEVNSISSSLRGPKKSVNIENRERVIGNLIKRSNEVNALKGKVKHGDLEHTQRNISHTIEEILSQVPRDSQLDLSAVETNSIVNIPVSKRSSLSRNTPDLLVKKQRTNQPIQLKQSIPTIRDIEEKMKTLKTQIQAAIENKDSTQLRVHQQTLKILAADLEMIEVPEETPLGDKKKKLDSSVSAYFQKISKAMKEIRRAKDIHYLAKQSKKEKILQDLNEINKELDESDQLLKLAIRNDDITAIKTIQQNLVVTNQKLTAVEVADEGTRNRKLQIVDKLAWLTNYASDATKKGSQSDITKAQTNYEDLIKNIARGKNKNQEDIKTKLESLQSFIDTIESEDDDSLKRKRLLLNNINVSLTSITDNELQKHKKNNTVDNGVLERKVSFDIKVLVENFFSDWRVLQDTLKSSSLNREELRLLDKLLSDIQISIAKTRKMMVNVYDVQSNLKTKLNKSAPNLSSSPHIHKKFASSLSVDQPNNIIKAKAKVYDLKIPEVHNVSDQVILRSTPPPQQNRFSEIDEIRTQISYIKEKFETSNQKQYFQNKLETYAKILGEYINNDNQRTANNARILLEDVKEMLKNINNLGLPGDKRGSIERSFQNITSVQESVDQIEKMIHEFHGNKGDEEYEKIKHMLIDSRSCLERIKVSQQYNTLQNQKYDLLNKIDTLLETLERKVTNTFYEEAFVQKTKKTLNSLKEKVNRFSGAYKGVLYNKLEKDLNRLLIDTENIEARDISDDIVKDTEKYLQILEHRATKDQSFRQNIRSTRSEEEEKMSNLKLELQNIKKNIDTTPMSAVKLFVALNSRLDLVKLGLDQLKNLNENIENQKQILYTEVETLKNVVDAKIALSQQSFRQWTDTEKKKIEERNNKATSELNKVEEMLKGLKEEIKKFIGTKSDKKFYELDEDTIRLTIKMDDLDLPPGNDVLSKRKSNLLKEVKEYEELLDQRAKETENMIQFERDIADIENNFQRYTNSTKELENLAERVKVLQLNLESSQMNSGLNGRKVVCVTRMRDMVSKIISTVEDNSLHDGKLTKLTLELDTIRKNLGKLTNEINSLDSIKKTLKSIRTNLDDITNLNVSNSQRRSKLYQEVEALDKIVDSKIAQAQIINKEKAKKEESNQKIKSELDKIEETMKTLRTEIENFIGLAVDSEYCELNEMINKLIGKLDVMKLEKQTTFYGRKVKLTKELYQCTEILENRAKNTEELLEYEQDVKLLESNFEKYSTKTLEEKIKMLQEKIQKTELNKHLTDRKNKCEDKLKDLIKKLDVRKINEVKEIEVAFLIVKEKIDSFAGTEDDLHYSEIMDNIADLSLKLDSLQYNKASKMDEAQELLRKDINNYTQILQNKSKENHTFQLILNKLNDIKENINKSKKKEELAQFHKDLNGIQRDIEKSIMSAKLKNDAHKRCILLLQAYSKKINELQRTNYIGSSGFITDVAKHNTLEKQIESNPLDQEIDDIGHRIDQLGQEIGAFVGKEDGEDYKKLEDALLKLNLRVKKLKVPVDSVHHGKKLKLKEKVTECLTVLDDRVQEFENLSEIETQTDKIDKSLDGEVTEEEKNAIDESLITLQVKLGKLKVANVLTQKKTKIMQKILNSMKKLKEKVVKTGSSDDEDYGTSV